MSDAAIGVGKGECREARKLCYLLL